MNADVLEFEKKNDMFRNGYKRGLWDYEFHQIDLATFIDTLFHRGRLYEDCFEEEMSREYLIWAKQRDDTDKDYSAYRYFRYNPIIFSKEGKKNMHRILLHDDRNTYQWIEGRQFAIMPPATFVGKNNTNKNARYLYAIAIDLDGVDCKRLEGFLTMCMFGDVCPVPNIITNSGHGLHVYYLLKEPVPLYNDAVWKAITKLKHSLTNSVWQPRSSNIEKSKIQFQPVLQAFRLPGTMTKFGSVITAWETIGVKEYTIEELNAFCPGSFALTSDEIKAAKGYPYNPNKITLDEAKRLFPEWYQQRVVEKKKVGKVWKVRRAVYDWWIGMLKDAHKDIVGHRYWSIMVLFIYASKCGIPLEEAMQDAMSFLDPLDKRTTNEDNHFTEDDIKAASKAYHIESCKFPIKKIEALTLFHIDRPSRRNGRKQDLHLRLARAQQNVLCQIEGKDWREGNGRKKGSTVQAANSPQYAKIQQWRKENPECDNKSRCAQELGMDRKTVRKWWKPQDTENQ